MNEKPLIAHVLYRLDTGGMERVLVTVVNRTRSKYRHAVICLDSFSAFRGKIEDPDVPCLALHKKPGKAWGCGQAHPQNAMSATAGLWRFPIRCRRLGIAWTRRRFPIDPMVPP